MAQDPDQAGDVVFDDPKASPNSKKIVRGAIALSFLHDGTATGGPLWQKAKNLTRNELWALAGFGTTTAFDTWTVEELNKLGAALGAHLGKPYMGSKYICCTCC